MIVLLLFIQKHVRLTSLVQLGGTHYTLYFISTVTSNYSCKINAAVLKSTIFVSETLLMSKTTKKKREKRAAIQVELVHTFSR